jgi:parallel beta-helix repeat protein
MRQALLFVLLIGFCIITSSFLQEASSQVQGAPIQQELGTPIQSEQSAPVEKEQAAPVKGKTFYVRQTIGDDANDGISPETAWRHIFKLSSAMHAGDTAYIGPGLYREQITVLNDGTAENRLTFIADTTGRHTGDPPGVVMITSAEPVDENIFVPYSSPGVYKAQFSDHRVFGAVEMDGLQYRYNRVTQTKEYLVDKMPPVDVVAKFPSSFFFDEEAKVLYIHTSDGKHPNTHELEIMRRLNGISMVGKHYITIIGFTFRHMGDAGINFFTGSGNGVAINNMVYGSRCGIRVRSATNIMVYGNTLFRNENSGIYFLSQSVNGLAIGNIGYENIKGIRWGSKSVKGMAIDNTLFDNHEAGISVEDTNDVLLRRNNMVNNKRFQFLVIQSEFSSEGNCFERGNPEQLTADFFFTDRYKSLSEYQKAKHQDLYSREGNCAPLPEKVDVRKLHEETMAYAERARKILSESKTKNSRGAGGKNGEGIP